MFGSREQLLREYDRRLQLKVSMDHVVRLELSSARDGNFTSKAAAMRMVRDGALCSVYLEPFSEAVVADADLLLGFFGKSKGTVIFHGVSRLDTSNTGSCDTGMWLRWESPVQSSISENKFRYALGSEPNYRGLGGFQEILRKSILSGLRLEFVGDGEPPLLAKAFVHWTYRKDLQLLC